MATGRLRSVRFRDDLETANCTPPNDSHLLMPTHNINDKQAPDMCLKSTEEDAIGKYLCKGFWLDLVTALPLPQILIWAAIPNLRGSEITPTSIVVRFLIIFQYLLRLYHIYPLTSEIVKANGVMMETAWAGAVYNLMLCMLASHGRSYVLQWDAQKFIQFGTESRHKHLYWRNNFFFCHYDPWIGAFCTAYREFADVPPIHNWKQGGLIQNNGCITGNYHTRNQTPPVFRSSLKSTTF
nr:protein cngc15c [Quercus suber]